MLIRKIRLTFIPKSFQTIWCLWIIKILKFGSLLTLSTEFSSFLYFVMASYCCFLLALSVERFIMASWTLFSTWGWWLSCKTLAFIGGWASKFLAKVSWRCWQSLEPSSNLIWRSVWKAVPSRCNNGIFKVLLHLI